MTESTREIGLGQSRTFHTRDGGQIAVTRTGDHRYFVVIPGKPCYTRNFDAARGDLPTDRSIKRHTWDYVVTLASERGGFAEDTQAMIETVTAPALDPSELWPALGHETYTFSELGAVLLAQDRAKVSPAQIVVLRESTANGFIRRGSGVSDMTLRALARQGLGKLQKNGYTVVGLVLNSRGLRLAEALRAETSHG